MRWTLPKTASMRQTGYNSHPVKENVHHEISTLSIDLAKNVFQVAGFNHHHKREYNKRLNRAKLYAFMANIPPCHVVMEACYSSHYWGRVFTP